MQGDLNHFRLASGLAVYAYPIGITPNSTPCVSHLNGTGLGSGFTEVTHIELGLYIKH